MGNVVVGKNGITAEVVQHSKSPEGKSIVTMCIKYGLIVHGEFLRHRVFSSSVKSNRAIPMPVIRKEVIDNPYIPVWFGAAQKGMSAANEVTHKGAAVALWKFARYPALLMHWCAEKLGAHKEWANRLLYPWQYVTQTVTFTEFANFLDLRLHEAAQKDIQELARVMSLAFDQSEVLRLNIGEWHTPYVRAERNDAGVLCYFDNNGAEMNADGAIRASTARCARSSYNKHDNTSTTLHEDAGLYNMLITTKPTHGSPAEHVATPCPAIIDTMSFTWPLGVTHVDNKRRLWSGNLVGWIQHRQQLEGHVKW